MLLKLVVPLSIAAVPLLAFVAMAVWNRILQRKWPLEVPAEPFWPSAANPWLALELARTSEEIDVLLGCRETDCGARNRQSISARLKFSVVSVMLPVVFFVVGALWIGNRKQTVAVALLAMYGAVFEVMKNRQLARMLAGRPGCSARRFGQWKWFFYFAAVMATGLTLLPATWQLTARNAAGGVLGGVLILNGLGGAISALRGSFNGIASGMALSVFTLAAFSVAPLVALPTFSWRELITYLVLIRVPLLLALVLAGLPFAAFFTGARSLLRGLFDLTPAGLFVVTLTALAAARTAWVTATMVMVHGVDRFHLESFGDVRQGPVAVLLAAGLLALPVIAFGTVFSIRQKHGSAKLIGTALSAAVLALTAIWLLDRAAVTVAGPLLDGLGASGVTRAFAMTGMFEGYFTWSNGRVALYSDHLSAAAAFFGVAGLYAAVGYYGYRKLGKSRTVPALTSALMLLMMLTWLLAGATFFLDRWRIPLLLLLTLTGMLTAQSAKSDHFYQLRRRKSMKPAPDAATTIAASGAERVIVVAANGGGIQAGAWAAKVLQGLYEDSNETFARALRMISAVSGGSVGTAFFVHWLANRRGSRPPAEAAASSSLDEVAWGLGWTDFLHALLPWVFGRLIGRGRALERAWCLNAVQDHAVMERLDDPLSSWNERVAAGELPGIVLNATIAETGERLILGTTGLGPNELEGRARIDAADLHYVNNEPYDIGVITAARLSASFPYVTPAARSNGPGPQPHVVDGGYYDNYGMATLVEWLDAALTGTDKIKSVLVVEVLGAPIDRNVKAKRHGKSRGWFYQAFAPLATLVSVRSAGQLAHNDIELALLQQKWMAAGVPIHTVEFEFTNCDAPLSWHLIRDEIENIERAWKEDMTRCREFVRRYLAGHDDLQCGCPACQGRGKPSKVTRESRVDAGTTQLPVS